MRIINNHFGCKTWKDGFCIECSKSYIFNKNGVCCKVDANCENFNRDVGVCELCYTGFHVDANGTCSVRDISDPALKGCAKWNNLECEACAAKHYFDADKVCQAVSPHCREWDTTTGECTSCYHGFMIDNGNCVLNPNAPGSAETAGNPLCAEWNDVICVKCAERAYFDVDGICR